MQIWLFASLQRRCRRPDGRGEKIALVQEAAKRSLNVFQFVYERIM